MKAQIILGAIISILVGLFLGNMIGEMILPRPRNDL